MKPIRRKEKFKMKFKEVNKLPIDVKETIKKRVSTRSFLEKSLTNYDRIKLMDFYKTLTNPFGVDVKYNILVKRKVQKMFN